jgi:copper(I)-binding protein
MVMVTNARVNTPVVKDETGAYANVTNNSGTDISLTGVSVPSSYAASAGLHKMGMVNGKMSMVSVASIPIKAGATLQLKPGGFHMMLMMPMCKTGDTVPITFTFSDGTTATADATVQMPKPSASPSMKM